MNQSCMISVTLLTSAFFSDASVHTALLVGGLAAVLSGLAGIFTVTRGQSFAGHAFSDFGMAGGSGAFLLALNPLSGFVALNVGAATLMQLLGVRRQREKDIVTGLILVATSGLSALFLFLDTTQTHQTNPVQTILFGSIFTLLPDMVAPVLALAIASAVVLFLIWRPLLLVTVSGDLAAARGVPTGLVTLMYLVALALAVSLSALTIGAILSTALLIGPAAISLRLTARPALVPVLASIFGLVSVWLGVLIAYDSYYWFPNRAALSVSAVVVILIFLCFSVTHLVPVRRAVTLSSTRDSSL